VQPPPKWDAYPGGKGTKVFCFFFSRRRLFALSIAHASKKTLTPFFHVPNTRPSKARPSNGVFCALPGSLPDWTCQILSG
jgi:hypothetical protein